MPIVRLPGLDEAVGDDPLLAEYRGVSDAALLRRYGLFVAEGREVVRRLLESPQYRLRSLLLNDAALAAFERTIPYFPPADVPVFVAPPAAFERMTGVHIHRGCLAIARRLPMADAAALLETARLVVVLERVANADNVGGVFRNAAAFGVDAVLIDPASCDPLYRKAIRTSAAASLAVPFARLAPWPEALDSLKAAGFTILALTPRAGAVSLERVAAAGRPPRLALLLGAEGDGLTDAACSRADCQVRIPVAPGVDSLNVAVAAGIALSRLGAIAQDV